MQVLWLRAGALFAAALLGGGVAVGIDRSVGGDGGTTRGKQSDRRSIEWGPKTSGADRRLSWSLGVGFASATLNATNESLYISYQIRFHPCVRINQLRFAPACGLESLSVKIGGAARAW